MMRIVKVCSKLVEALGVVGSKSRSACTVDSNLISCKPADVDDLTIRALTEVFGMENDGKIKKENARKVVENLGLPYFREEEDDKSGEEMAVEEVIGGLGKGCDSDRLLEAFKIFDEDGNGYIEAEELKRVLQCLGLDKGLDLKDMEKMLQVVDLNFDGKVDFSEFECMMMTSNSN